MQLEVMVTDASEALQAQQAGASRVELVTRLECGGLTPDAAIVESVTRAVSIPVHVMLRPHDQGFNYNRRDRETIFYAAAQMRELGVAAVVFGALDDTNHVAAALVNEVLAVSRLPMTFHRAFDVTPSLTGAYAVLSGIVGVHRVLTAGGAHTAWDGRTSLRELSYGNTVPTVLAGGGIDASNLRDLVRFARIPEVHVGRGARTDGRIDAYKVERLVNLLNGGTAR
jgi:copper homeostasis protein